MTTTTSTKVFTLVQIAKKSRVDQKLARFRLRRAIAAKKNVPTSQSSTRWEFREKDVVAVRDLISTH